MPDVPDNDTAYLVTHNLTILFSLTNGPVFDLISVDLSKASASVPDPYAGSFVGYLPDGSTVSTNFSASGLVFQTFQFGPEFSGLTRVEIPSAIPWTYWAVDNLVFSAIPEPSTLMLFGVGGCFLAANLIRKRVSRSRRKFEDPLVSPRSAGGNFQCRQSN